MRKRICMMLLAVMLVVPLAFCLTACGGNSNSDSGKLSKEEWVAKFDAIKAENVGSYTLTFDDTAKNEKHLYKIDYDKKVAYHRWTHTIESSGEEIVSEYYAVKKGDNYYACSKAVSTWVVAPKDESFGEEWLKQTGGYYMVDFMLSSGREDNYQRFDYDSSTQIYKNQWNGARFKFDENAISYWYDGEVENPYVMTNCGATTVDVPDHLMAKIDAAE